jgi:hypothetical protein
MSDCSIRSDAGGPYLAAPCAYCTAETETETGDAAVEGPWPPERLGHLYICRELSTYRIADLTGLNRQRVTQALHQAGVSLRPRGAGRLRPLRRAGDPPGLPQLMAELYQVARLSSRQIATITSLPERTVRDRLRRYGIQARSRGRWNREDRRTVPVQTLRDLYQRLGLTAAQVGVLTGTSGQTVLRSAHALGVPVRAGGAVPLAGPEEIELVAALYQDELIASVLADRDIPQVPPGGPIWARFPEPIPLSAPLVKDLYWQCGAALTHIELLTGQPAMTIRGFMRRQGIPVRHPGGRTPFLRRWRTGPERSTDTSPGCPHLSLARSGQGGYHGDDCDQGDKHVRQVRVEAAGLEPFRDHYDRHEQPERGPV